MHDTPLSSFCRVQVQACVTSGRLLVEVFEDRIPLAARQLLNRCRPGSDGCFQGTTVPKLLPHLGVFILGARYCFVPASLGAMPPADSKRVLPVRRCS